MSQTTRRNHKINYYVFCFAKLQLLLINFKKRRQTAITIGVGTPTHTFFAKLELTIRDIAE